MILQFVKVSFVIFTICSVCDCSPARVLKRQSLSDVGSRQPLPQIRLLTTKRQPVIKVLSQANSDLQDNEQGTRYYRAVSGASTLSTVRQHIIGRPPVCHGWMEHLHRSSSARLIRLITKTPDSSSTNVPKIATFF